MNKTFLLLDIGCWFWSFGIEHLFFLHSQFILLLFFLLPSVIFDAIENIIEKNTNQLLSQGLTCAQKKT